MGSPDFAYNDGNSTIHFWGGVRMDAVKAIKGYELHERIGSGGFGVVHRATQTTVGREVAIKIILPHFANQPDFIRRFETEAQIIARLERRDEAADGAIW
jgi:serine/threonine protein kinase